MTEIRFFIYLFFNEAIFRTIILTFFFDNNNISQFFFYLMSKVYYILSNLYDQQLSKVNLINITLFFFIFTTKLTKNKA